MRRSQLVRLATMAIFPLALLLAGCASLGPMAGSSAAPTPVAASPTVQPAQPTRTVATLGGSAPWYTWTEPSYGYQLDLPGYVAPESTTAFGAQGEGFSWQTPQIGSQQISQITVQSATQIHSSDCVQGKPITVGSGTPGVENDTFILTGTPPPNAGAPGSTIIAAFSSNGVYVVIRMQAAPQSGQTFQQEYGDTWRHILASFKPGAKSFGTGSLCS